MSRFPGTNDPATPESTGLRRRPLSSVMSTCCLALALGAVAPAMAQSDMSSDPDPGVAPDESVLLEKVVVTVRRIEEISDTVPLTIRVIDEQEILRRGIYSIEDVARLTPGLTYDLGGFPNDTRPAVRGMQAERGRPSVAVMIDGIDLSGENLAISGGGAGVVPDLMDLERIEIVKGPQTTLYGRNAFAGAINYITKRPSDVPEGRLELELAEFGHRRAAGMISGPIVEDVLGYRINAAYRENDGFWTNPVNGGPLGAQEFQGIAGALQFTPTEAWDINLRYQVSSTDHSDYPTAQLPANTRLPVPDGTFTAGPPGSPSLPCPADLSGQPAPVVGACTRGTIVGPVRADIDDVQMGFNEVTGRPPRGLELDQQIVSLDAAWDIGFGKLRYTLGWIDNESFVEADGDFTDFDGPPGFVFSLSALQQLDYADERFDHNLFWTHSFGTFSVLIGAQYLEEESALVNSSSFWVRNPDSPLGGPPFFLATEQVTPAFPVRITRDTEYSAVFGKMNWNITETLRLGLEARYNSDDIEYGVPGWRLQDVSLRGLEPVCLPGLPQGAIFMGVPGPDVPPPGTVQACPRSESLSYNEWTPRVTLDWQINDNVMVYGNVARGFKPGGFNVNELIDFDGQGYLPEFVDAYEVGVKSFFPQARLAIDAAVFYNDYTDQQIGVQLNQTGAGDTIVAIPGIANAAEVESKGFEIAAAWTPFHGLNLDLGYAYTDATFQDYVQGPAPNAVTGPETFAACGVPFGQTSSPQIRAEAGNACADFSGNAVAKSPKHAVNAGALYRGSLNDRGDTWFVELNAQYRSKRYVSEANRAWMPSYTNYDLQAGLEFDRFSVVGFVSNLTDDDTIRTAQRNVDPGRPEGFAPGRAIIAYLPEPRVAGVRFIYRFGTP
ncbi:TonB-dependent receptor [Wenzhouxiangella sp. XN79A]|uniref:TonB-dependent receptor domain-containing protein n=1 Tax=Wenzhouxiangella sp. XN79A TaxID=2724193 RepID=UPI00144A8B56|nr:TonB-dependent receptor [Wenzhouxiangella sp. XN79A]